MPVGIFPQAAGILTGSTTSLAVRGDMEDNYIRGALNLPSIAHPLTRNGIIGGPIHRDAEEERKREESRLQKIKEQEDAEKRKKGLMQARDARVNHNRPMFNGPMGRPKVDAFGQSVSYRGNGEYSTYTMPMPVGGGGGGNRGFVAPEFAHLLGGGKRDRRAFMRDREE
jgi:hypothetical protein